MKKVVMSVNSGSFRRDLLRCGRQRRDRAEGPESARGIRVGLMTGSGMAKINEIHFRNTSFL